MSEINIIIAQEKRISYLKKENLFLKEMLCYYQHNDKDKLFEKLDLMRIERDKCLYNYHQIAEDIGLLCSDLLLIEQSSYTNSDTITSDIATAMEDMRSIDVRIKRNCY